MKIVAEKQMISLILALMLTCTWTTVASAQEPGANAKSETDKQNAFEVRSWKPALSGETKVTSRGYGTTVSFKDDLKMNDAKNIGEIRLKLGKARLAYANLSYNGNATLAQPIQFNGQTFDVNTNLASNLDIKYYRVGWELPISAAKNVQQNWLLDLKILDLDTKLTAMGNINQNQSVDFTVNQTAAKRLTVPVPTFGYNINAKLSNRWDMYAEISGLPLAKYGSFYDAEIGVKYCTSSATIGAGYRVFNINLQDGGDHFKYRLSGPFINASLKF